MVGEIEVKGKGENAQLAKHIQYLNTLENNKNCRYGCCGFIN